MALREFWPTPAYSDHRYRECYVCGMNQYWATLDFTAGQVAPAVGETLTGAVSGNTGVVKETALYTGAYASTVIYPPDVPGTRGTEWDIKDAAWVPSSIMGMCYQMCIAGTVLLCPDNNSHHGGAWPPAVIGFNLADGSENGRTASHEMLIQGIAQDGTYFYISGALNYPPYTHKIKKYRISDYSYISECVFADGTGAGEVTFLNGIQTHGGVLYCFDYNGFEDVGNKKMVLVNASTMVYSSEVAWPEYSTGNRWTLSDHFCMDDTGTYMWAGGNRADEGASAHTLKLRVSDLSVVTDGQPGGATEADTLYHKTPFYYIQGSDTRIFAVDGTYGGTSGIKVNPGTCLKYYDAVTFSDESSCAACDGSYLYLSVWHTPKGVQRLYMNILPPPPVHVTGDATGRILFAAPYPIQAITGWDRIQYSIFTDGEAMNGSVGGNSMLIGHNGTVKVNNRLSPEGETVLVDGVRYCRFHFDLRFPKRYLRDAIIGEEDEDRTGNTN